MVHPFPVSQCLHNVFTGFATAVTSRISQQQLHDPHCRPFCFVGMLGVLKPSLSRIRRFCFSSEYNARSTLRRDSPVRSITPRIVVAPLSTATTTFEITSSMICSSFSPVPLGHSASPLSLRGVGRPVADMFAHAGFRPGG